MAGVKSDGLLDKPSKVLLVLPAVLQLQLVSFTSIDVESCLRACEAFPLYVAARCAS